MKARIKHTRTSLGAIESGQLLLKKFRSLPIFTKKFSTPVPNDSRFNLTATSTAQERLAAAELERRQGTGRAYVNMLPPR
jgi:hypothetical protein